jgi:hypothetical protein
MIAGLMNYNCPKSSRPATISLGPRVAPQLPTLPAASQLMWGRLSTCGRLFSETPTTNRSQLPIPKRKEASHEHCDEER